MDILVVVQVDILVVPDNLAVVGVVHLGVDREHLGVGIQLFDHLKKTDSYLQLCSSDIEKIALKYQYKQKILVIFFLFCILHHLSLMFPKQHCSR